LRPHDGFSALVPIPNGRGGIVPPHSVLAPGTALGLLPSRALPSAQVNCIVAREKILQSRTKTKRREKAKFRPVVRSELLGNLRSLPFGPTRVRPCMRGLGEKSPSQAARRSVWSGPYGEEFAPDKSASAGSCPAELLAGYRGRYLAKECVGSNRIGKERLQLPAAKRRQPDESKNHTSKSHDALNAISCDE
jgi:hypothetical protein